MSSRLFKPFLIAVPYLTLLFSSSKTFSNDADPQSQLREIYECHCSKTSDINEHVPVLRDLAKQCGSVVEIGLRTMVSTYGILQGLSENSGNTRYYLGIDIDFPPQQTLNQAATLSQANGILFEFWKANDMNVDIDTTDMLFIDSLHTYCHLTYELEKFSPKVRKFIAMHDTSAPWGDQDDNLYNGNYTEYPAGINRNKRGLWPAVEDFLSSHPDWTLLERRLNNHGFTILKRV